MQSWVQLPLDLTWLSNKRKTITMAPDGHAQVSVSEARQITRRPLEGPMQVLGRSWLTTPVKDTPDHEIEITVVAWAEGGPKSEVRLKLSGLGDPACLFPHIETVTP
jgi:hypothetical protein